MSDELRRGWDLCKAAALARCGPRNTVAECIEAIQAMQPPDEIDGGYEARFIDLMNAVPTPRGDS